MMGKFKGNGMWLAILLGAIFLSGCASQSKQESDAYRATSELNYAASAWIDEHNYHKAVYGLERALDKYEGRSFEQSALTVLALVHLERGEHGNFLETASRLEQQTGHKELVPRQTQHVLLVSAAMNQRPRSDLPGRGYDSVHGQSIYSLLGARENR